MRFLLAFLIIIFTAIGRKKDAKQDCISQKEELFISAKQIPDSHFLRDNN